MPTRQHRAHDVVVVGARAAGAATGLLLARMGHDVAVLERAQFPRDTLSTHSISRSGVVQLARWGLLDQVMASGAPPIRQTTFHSAGESVTRQVKDRAGVDHLVAPRRRVLDTIGADGLRSGVARSVGASVDVARPSGGATHYAYYSGPTWRGIEFFVEDGTFAGVFPTNDGEACIWVCTPADRAETMRRRTEKPATELVEMPATPP